MNVPPKFATFAPPDCDLAARLESWAEHNADGAAFCFLRDGEDDEVNLTYGELDHLARGIAARLIDMGMSGERALFLYPPGLEFVAALWGCFYAGVTAVPAYPPKKNRNMGRIQAISDDARAAIALTTREILDRTMGTLDEAPHLQALTWLATDEIPPVSENEFRRREIRFQDLAVLQYTSGSTGTPKGVMLSHGNLVANCVYIHWSFEMTRDGKGLTWLPTYHDMGLVGGVLSPLYFGRPNVLMSPMAFLQKPIRWLRGISKHGVTVSGGPNFAYELCVDKITEEQCQGLDLRRWDVAFNGAEPIRAETLDRFTRKFAPYGFHVGAHYACYGMAETTLIVTGSKKGDLPVIRNFASDSLEKHQVAPSSPTDPNSRRLVGCGGILPGEVLVIVDPETGRELPPGNVGEIWVCSPSVGLGYWEKPELTQTVFKNRLANHGGKEFLRTGDLGFLEDGELFVTGRIKDLIIVRGVNRYPQDIELTVERTGMGLVPGAVAAFSVDIAGRERLVIVGEVERRRSHNWSSLIHEIRSRVTVEHELPPDAVVLVREKGVPKTSSGKIQRHAAREAFIAGELEYVSAWKSWEEAAEHLPEAWEEGAEVEAQVRSPSSNGKHPHGVSNGVASPQQEKQSFFGSDLPANGSKRTENHSGSRSAAGASSAEGDKGNAGSVLQTVMEHVRTVAKDRARELEADTNIVELGLDSLERLEIINSLEGAYGGRFPESILPEIETCREVAAAIEKHLLAGRTAGEKVIPEDAYNFSLMPEYRRLKLMEKRLLSTGAPNPYFKVHEGTCGATTRIAGADLINFSSFNYVGMSGDPYVHQAAKDAIDRFGSSVSASRLVSGEKTIHKELEAALARFLGQDDAITFVSGHGTNESTIGHLFGPGDLVLHDALAHNSIIKGAELSGATRRPFPHNDWESLDATLKQVRFDYRRVLIAIEGLYSMDGDFPDLPRFLEIKRRHKALILIDEAHSVGTLGLRGRGICEHYGVDPREVDLSMGTLSKSLGSCGGYIAACQEAIEYLRYTTPAYVFATGLSPAAAGAALAAVQLLEREPERVAKVQARSRFFLQRAKQRGLNTGRSDNTPVVPIITGSSPLALYLSHRMQVRGVNVQPILHPAVEEELARLRFFISSLHSEEQIAFAIDALAEEIASANAS